MPTTQTSTFTVGHTPDLDDAFMFYGIASGAISLDGIRIEHVIEDIQALNRRAADAQLDMTAISAAAYPALAQHYAIVAVGSSIGQNYGPLLVSQHACSPEELRGKRIAVPGLQTTAFLLLRLAIGQYEPVEMRFEEIPEAVVAGKVEGGLLIHERQITYRDQGLLPILDLGTWWHKEAGLPLPLGLNVVKRSLEPDIACRLATVLRESILHGFAHQDEALAYAMRFGRGIDPVRARQFIGMYVNEDTLALSPACRDALQELFQRAHEAELIPEVPPLNVIEPAK